MKRLGVCVLLVPLGACGPNISSLMPNGNVIVYADSECRSAIASTGEPLDVLGLVYPDKTDYIVRVEFRGQPAYVCEGDFELN